MSKGCIITTEDGKRWRILGDSAVSMEAKYLTSEGIVEWDEADRHPGYVPVVPVLDTVMFGGVVFERTGKREETTGGKWYLGGAGTPFFVSSNESYKAICELLRHAGVEVANNKD